MATTDSAPYQTYYHSFAMYHALISVHVLAACIWVGGALFLGGIALPAARALDHDQSRRRAIRTIARRFRTVGWIALAILVATGLYLATRWGLTWSNTIDLSFFTADGRLRAHLLGYKLLVVMTLLVTSFLHDWVIGPRTSDADPGTDHHQRLQTWSALLGSATALLSVAVVILAVLMVRPS